MHEKIASLRRRLSDDAVNWNNKGDGATVLAGAHRAGLVEHGGQGIVVFHGKRDLGMRAQGFRVRARAQDPAREIVAARRHLRPCIVAIKERYRRAGLRGVCRVIRTRVGDIQRRSRSRIARGLVDHRRQRQCLREVRAHGFVAVHQQGIGIPGAGIASTPVLEAVADIVRGGEHAGLAFMEHVRRAERHAVFRHGRAAMFRGLQRQRHMPVERGLIVFSNNRCSSPFTSI